MEQDSTNQKSGAGVLVGVFLISAATLHLELLHTRLLSFSLWYSLVYAVITLALLGFGISGAVLASFPRLRDSASRSKLSLFSLGLCLSMVVGLAIAVRIPINCFAMSKLQQAKLSFLFLLLTLPYCFAGGVVALAFTSFKGQTNKLYFANMTGSGVGCLAFVLTVGPLGGERSLFLVAVLAVVAGLAFSVRGNTTLRVILIAAAVLVGVPGFLVPTKVLPLKTDPNKALSRWTNPREYPDATIEYSGWSPLSRVDVVHSPSRMVAERPDGTPISWKVITTDGDATTWIHSGVTDEQVERYRRDPRFYRSFRTLAYVTKRDPEVLLIGVGGGVDAYYAVFNGARRIVAVDINPITIHLVLERYADYTKRFFHRPEFTFIVSEGRSYVRRSGEQFDIIHMHGVDTFAALSSGAYVLAEHYLYTVEAFLDYFAHLKPDGILSITRFAFDYPRESLKLCATAATALREIGVSDPGNHIYVVKDVSSPWATLLCKKEPFSAEEQQSYDALFSTIPFRVMYKPGMDRDDAPTLVGPDRYYQQLMRSLRDGTPARFYREYKYDIQPPVDDRPFFFKYYKWSLLGSVISDGTGWAGAEGPLGLFILSALILSTFLATLVLIVAPLWKFNRDGLRVPRAFRFITYFVCLGLGYMFIEIALLQKFVLFLGHPVYSIAVILFAMLLFSGVGSLLAGQLKASRKRIINTAVIAIVAFILIYTATLHDIFVAFLGHHIILRCLISVLLVAPLAICMGMPYPTGLRTAGDIHPALVAWAFGVNGSASVLSSILAVVFAMIGGFSAVFVLSIAIYVIAAISIYPILSHRNA